MNWLQEEKARLEEVRKNTNQYLKFEENEMIEFTVDTKKPFEEVIDQWGKVKARIPCVVNGQTKFWDISKLNPVYNQMIDRMVKFETLFRVIRTGQGEQTKYALVK